MLATTGGISAVIALLAAAHHNNGYNLSLDFSGIKSFWGIVTAGVLWAGIFNWLFEKWVWRFGFLQGWLIKVPDLSGIWVGVSESHYFKTNDGSFERIDIEVNIAHQFDRIVYTQQGDAKIVALTTDLSKDESGFCELTVVYYNPPQIANSPNTREHYGCVRLRLYKPPKERTTSGSWQLKGEYWTSKSRFPDREDRGTTGIQELSWLRRC
jgi:hypothetical protein